jgi:serine protease AprX
MRQFTDAGTNQHGSGCTRGFSRAFGTVGVAVLILLALPLAATAQPRTVKGNDLQAFVPPPVLDAARAEPNRVFEVIVQGAAGKRSADVAAEVLAEGAGRGKAPRQFRSIEGVAAHLTGKQLLKLATKKGVSAITLDAPVQVTGYSSKQKWPATVRLQKLWGDVSEKPFQQPTIAIVDSGVDASRADLGSRLIKQVTMTSLVPNSRGDGRGHGTFVASIAAGSAKDYAGASPTAKLVSIDVADDAGMAITSDVIAAADWILANKDEYGIRVANFSLHSSQPGGFMFDPLDKAVERLWFGGVVVVAAAGNYAVAGEDRGVPFAPGNDPFVITVGAADIKGDDKPENDFAAPWSASGYTLDGFAKPDVGAPGRYMIGAIPLTSTLALERPDKLVGLSGYIQLSGTSFAAPVVAGVAAQLLAVHPEWTPDQVKGALMLTTSSTAAAPLTLGVGEINAERALDVRNPPNPNLALNRFLVADPTGGPLPVFDAASWTSAAQLGASWTSASWTSASWTSASWTSASWTSASWTSASWTSASWTSASWTSASWTSASWTSASWTSASWVSATWTSASRTSESQLSSADDDSVGAGYAYADDELLANEISLGLDLNGDAVVGPIQVEPTPPLGS